MSKIDPVTPRRRGPDALSGRSMRRRLADLAARADGGDAEAARVLISLAIEAAERRRTVGKGGDGDHGR